MDNMNVEDKFKALELTPIDYEELMRRHYLAEDGVDVHELDDFDTQEQSDESSQADTYMYGEDEVETDLVYFGSQAKYYDGEVDVEVGVGVVVEVVGAAGVNVKVM